jgi:hypothetical protein
VTYTTAAQVRAQFAPYLRPVLRAHLDGSARPVKRAVAELTRAVEAFITWPGYQVGVVEARDTERLIGAVLEYAREIENIAVMLALARAYTGTDLEDALAQIFRAALQQRRDLPRIGVLPQSIWTYGAPDLPKPALDVDQFAKDARTRAYLLHAKRIADTALQLLRELQRCAGKPVQATYGSAKGPVIGFIYDTLGAWLPMLLPGVELHSAEHLRKILEDMRAVPGQRRSRKTQS